MKKEEILNVEDKVSSETLYIRHASCPKGHSLMDNHVTIHGHSSLKVIVRFDDKEGILFLDPVYGSFDHDDSDLPLPMGKVVQLFCPTCKSDLTDPHETCHVCSSAMFQFHLPRGSVIEGCLKKGCFYHKLTSVDGEQQLARMYENTTLESFL
ncbi:MAG: hypothetical protein GF313_12255 [Caldithrix sp.]|nr:hypothetical protein [Caldithrix sp.]